MRKAAKNPLKVLESSPQGHLPKSLHFPTFFTATRCPCAELKTKLCNKLVGFEGDSIQDMVKTLELGLFQSQR